MRASVKAPLFGPASFYRGAISLAVPVMLQQLIMNLVSLIDNFMVAGLGDVKMAAVNVANQINFVYFVILFTLCNAGGIYMSQFSGAKNRTGTQQAFRFKVLMGMGVSVIHLFLCQVMPERLLGLMTGGPGSAAIVAEGARYLRIVSIMWLPIAVSTAYGTAFREIGRPKPPLFISAGATLVNTFFNWVFIYGNLGAPRLDVAGAALATNVARAVELAAYIIYVRRDRPSFRVTLREFTAIDGRVFRAILGKSWMMILSETTWVTSETILTALYNRRGGADVVAGMSAGFTLANLLFLVFAGVQTATGVIVGGTLGANRLSEARTKARWIKSGSVIAGFIMTGGAVLTTLIIPVVFGNLSPSARSITRGLVFVIAGYMPVWTYLNAQFAVARSGGDTSMGVWVDVGVTVTMFIPLAFILADLTTLGPVVIFALVKLTDFVKMTVAAWWLRKERWVRNLTADTERDAAAQVRPAPAGGDPD